MTHTHIHAHLTSTDADVSPLDSLSSDSDDCITSKSAPLVIINNSDKDVKINRRGRFHKAATAGSPTPSGSPSPPLNSPRISPAASPRGVRKFLRKVTS